MEEDEIIRGDNHINQHSEVYHLQPRDRSIASPNLLCLSEEALHDFANEQAEEGLSRRISEEVNKGGKERRISDRNIDEKKVRINVATINELSNKRINNQIN